MRNYKILLFILLFLVCPLYSFINPEIKKAIRKSFPDKLEKLLALHKLQEDEKTILLAQAREFSKIYHEKMANDDLCAKKKRASYIKLFLSGIGGLTCAACVPLTFYKAFVTTKKEDFIGNATAAAVLGPLGAILIRYNIRLYKKICKARNYKQKYLDATEVEHILNKA